MNQILEEEEMKNNLKRCLESFEIISNKKQKQSKKNLYQYLLKKHFEMETNNNRRFSNKLNKLILSQNIPLKRKNESFSSTNNDKVFSQQETTQQHLSEKTISNTKQKQEYEYLILKRNGKQSQSFKARISEVYLDQPLLMLIFENQEIVKNNTKLKKQLAVSNNVLLNFFKEVNAKCNILKQLIFENEISNAKFFFSLLQNNIYSIEQYLKKRGIDGIANQNNQYQELSNFLPLNQRKSILQFQIISDQKIANTLIDLSKLLKNQPISPYKKNIQTYDKLPRLSSSFQGQHANGKRFSIPAGAITQNQISNIFSFPNDDLKDDQKTASQSSELEGDISINDYQDSKQQNMGNEQNDTDYINRIKIKGEYNLGNIFNKMQFNKQINIISQTTENTPQKMENAFPKSLLENKRDNSMSIASNSPDFQQIFSFLPENNKIQSNQFNSSNKLTNGNHSQVEENQQSSTNKIQKKENTQFDQTSAQVLSNTDQQVERNYKEQQIHQYLLSNANSPSASNFSIQHNQNPQHSFYQQEFTPFNQERNTQVEINMTTLKGKSSSDPEKPQNPNQIIKEKNKGNVRQFDFQNILDDINMFRNEINMKWDPSLNSTNIISDKDMILYILRSLFSSVLVINEIRKQQIANLKIKTFQNINKISPSYKRKILHEHQDKIAIKQSQNDINFYKSHENENQTHQSLIIKNAQNQKSYKLSDINNLSDDNKRDLNNFQLFLHKDSYQTNNKFKQENNSFQKLRINVLPSDNNFKISSFQSDQLTNATYREIALSSKRNQDKAKPNNNDSQFKKSDDGKKQLLYENKKSSFVLQKEKLQIDDKTSIEENHKKSRKDLNINQSYQENQQDFENMIDDEENLDIPFSMNEVDVEFSLEKNKYCQSLVVSINNISKEEVLSCLNLNSNKAVSQVEYEIIKLIIQRIGPYPLYFKAGKVCLAFLLDISDVVVGQSFFNMPLDFSAPQQYLQQEQILFQIPEEECDLPSYVKNKQTNEYNENNYDHQ